MRSVIETEIVERLL